MSCNGFEIKADVGALRRLLNLSITNITAQAKFSAF